MAIRQQLLDAQSALIAYNTVDIPDESPYPCSTVVWPTIDTPLVYPTGTLDVSNYAAVAMVLSGTSVNLAGLTECSINGVNWVPALGWPVSGGLQTAPNIVGPTSTPSQGQRGMLYIYPVEHANLFRFKVRLMQSGTVFATVGLLDRVPFIPGANLCPRDYSGNWWTYTGPAGGIVNNNPVVISVASSITGLARHLVSLQLKNVHASVETEYVVRDNAGATILHRGYLPALMKNNDNVVFEPPRKGTINTSMEFLASTTGAQIYVSAQGFTGAI